MTYIRVAPDTAGKQQILRAMIFPHRAILCPTALMASPYIATGANP
jgi:hypothetical protein